jgi:hypothetical protein
MNFSNCWRWDSTPIEPLEEQIRTVGDVDDGVLLEDLDELLQLLEVGLHPGLFYRGTRRAGTDCR